MVTINAEQLKIWQESDLEHLRYEYDLKQTDYVIDIGSYLREWGNGIKQRYGCEIESFEALDNKAAWIEDGYLYFGGAYYYSSIYEEVKPNTYRCYDIAPFLQREVALMKINIEGAEYELLIYIISKGLHKNIKHLQVQFHQVDDFDYQDIYKQIAEKLSLTHSIEWRYPFVWESWKRNEQL